MNPRLVGRDGTQTQQKSDPRRQDHGHSQRRLLADTRPITTPIIRMHDVKSNPPLIKFYSHAPPERPPEKPQEKRCDSRTRMCHKETGQVFGQDLIPCHIPARVQEGPEHLIRNIVSLATFASQTSRVSLLFTVLVAPLFTRLVVFLCVYRHRFVHRLVHPLRRPLRSPLRSPVVQLRVCLRFSHCRNHPVARRRFHSAYPLGCPRRPLGCPRRPLGCPRRPLGCPRRPLGCPRRPNCAVGCPRHPVGCPRHPVGCPRHPVGCPRHPVSCPRCACDICRDLSTCRRSCQKVHKLKLQKLHKCKRVPAVFRVSAHASTMECAPSYNSCRHGGGNREQKRIEHGQLAKWMQTVEQTGGKCLCAQG